MVSPKSNCPNDSAKISVGCEDSFPHEEISSTATGNVVKLAKSPSFLVKSLNSSSSSSSSLYPLVTAASIKTTSSKNLVYNKNGTSAWVCLPTNEVELQLFRIMQFASLLSYYDILLEMGGDDLNQLCEAPEDEFLEIMSLVGMAQKPLHVRRFQKSLLEWTKNPDIFRVPLNPDSNSTIAMAAVTAAAATAAATAITTQTIEGRTEYGSMPTASSTTSTVAMTAMSTIATISTTATTTAATTSASVAPVSVSPSKKSSKSTVTVPTRTTSSTSSKITISTPKSSEVTRNSTLKDWQVECLEKSARKLARTMKAPEAKKVPGKNKTQTLELSKLINEISDKLPYSMESVRKYAAIYGRFDCKRNPGKPLTLHEAAVNEAAAQICCLLPTLLTRRDELFPLARQAVRDSGYHYNEFCQLADEKLLKNFNRDCDKRPKLNLNNNNPPNKLSDFQSEEVALKAADKERENNSTSTKTAVAAYDSDDGSSRYSFSNSSSPIEVITNL